MLEETCMFWHGKRAINTEQGMAYMHGVTFTVNGWVNVEDLEGK